MTEKKKGGQLIGMIKEDVGKYLSFAGIDLPLTFGIALLTVAIFADTVFSAGAYRKNPSLLLKNLLLLGGGVVLTKVCSDQENELVHLRDMAARMRSQGEQTAVPVEIIQNETPDDEVRPVVSAIPTTPTENNPQEVDLDSPQSEAEQITTDMQSDNIDSGESKVE